MTELRSNFQDIFLTDALPVLGDVLFDEYDKQPDLLMRIFNLKSIDKWGHQSTTISGLGSAPQSGEGEPSATDSPIMGYDKTYIPVSYSLIVSLSEDLVEDDKIELASKTLRELGLSIYNTEQITGFNVLNNGFTVTGPDGVSLFSTAHPLLGGGTYNNRPSSAIALSVAGLRAMETSYGRMVNDRNITKIALPRQILVPVELKQTAKELLKSIDRPDTPNRSINTFYDENYELLVSPYLTSTTAWFAFGDKSQHDLNFIRRKAMEKRSWRDEPTGDYNTRARTKFDVGYNGWRCTWGTTG
jgi:hypothetical protein